MRLNRVFTYPQAIRDAPVRQPACKHRKHLALARRQQFDGNSSGCERACGKCIASARIDDDQAERDRIERGNEFRRIALTREHCCRARGERCVRELGVRIIDEHDRRLRKTRGDGGERFARRRRVVHDDLGTLALDELRARTEQGRETRSRALVAVDEDERAFRQRARLRPPLGSRG